MTSYLSSGFFFKGVEGEILLSCLVSGLPVANLLQVSLNSSSPVP